MARLVGGMTTDDVRAFLADLRFPVLKNDVVHAARKNGAPNGVVNMLENVPVTEFRSLDHLLESLPQLT